MRLIGFAGSPRLQGNSAVLLDEVCAGAREAGADAARFDLAKLKINPCLACAVCKTSGRCIVDDDFNSLRDEMERSDVYVLATPIYFWGPSAQLKAFVDRWYSMQLKGKGFMAGRRAALVLTFNSSSDRTARHTVGMFEDAFSYVGLDFAGRLLVSAADAVVVNSMPEVMAAARELGRKLVSDAQ